MGSARLRGMKLFRWFLLGCDHLIHYSHIVASNKGEVGDDAGADNVARRLMG